MSPKTAKTPARKTKPAPRATARKTAAKPQPKAAARKPAVKAPPKSGARKTSAKAPPKAVPRKPAPKAKVRSAPKPKPAAARPAHRTKRAAAPAPAIPRTLTEFMTHALVMEMEAAQRYADFADAMEMHNNLEVAALFRKMATIEDKHAQQIMAEMGWTTTPSPLPGAIRWDGFEAPETAAIDDVHYLMQPYHALEVALANELRAERFFAQLARAATTASVRKAARELQEEEREHVELVRAWMKKVPQPDADWADDPDPPRYTD
jgi:rubrerythrin